MSDREFDLERDGELAHSPPWAEVEAWFESQPEPSPDALAEALALVREAQVALRRELGLRERGTDTVEAPQEHPNEEVTGYSLAPDAQAVSDRVMFLIRLGHASHHLKTSW